MGLSPIYMSSLLSEARHPSRHTKEKTMLNKEQLALINEPVWCGSKCIGYRREFLKPEVAELVFECVHPSNFGALPPSSEMIAWKAKQIGLINTLDEAYEYRRAGQFN